MREPWHRQNSPEEHKWYARQWLSRSFPLWNQLRLSLSTRITRRWALLGIWNWMLQQWRNYIFWAISAAKFHICTKKVQCSHKPRLNIFTSLETIGEHFGSPLIEFFGSNPWCSKVVWLINDHHSWILSFGWKLDVVQRWVFVQVVTVFFIVRAAVLSTPEVSAGEFLETEHVQQAVKL